MGRLNKHLTEVINPCWNYAGRCETKKDEVMNSVLGLAGESGEVADVVKKMYFHTEKAKYTDDLKKELGDVIFYWLKTLDLFDFTIEEVLEGNKEKLTSRHPELGVVTERFGKDAIR